MDVVDALAVQGGVASRGRLIAMSSRRDFDRARRLPFDLALCVTDSALRHGVDHDTFVSDAAAVRGKGAAQARRVAALASPRPANPFESALRALTIEAGLDMEPQASIVIPGHGEPDREVHPDLVERTLGLVVEAESWEFHTGKEAFQRDCWRYTSLVVNGWMVLRFTWWQVTYQPDWVVACLIATRRALTAENAA